LDFGLEHRSAAAVDRQLQEAEEAEEDMSQSESSPSLEKMSRIRADPMRSKDWR